jgi:hypothetical protein
MKKHTWDLNLDLVLKVKVLNHVPLPNDMLTIYASVSQSVCRDTQVCC